MTIHSPIKSSFKHNAIRDQSDGYTVQVQPDFYQPRPITPSHVDFGQSAASPIILQQDRSVALDSRITWPRAISNSQRQPYSDWSVDPSNSAWSLAPASLYTDEDIGLGAIHLHSEVVPVQDTLFNQDHAQVFGLGYQFPDNFGQMSHHVHSRRSEPRFLQRPDWIEELFSNGVESSAAPPTSGTFIPVITEQVFLDNLMTDTLMREGVIQKSVNDIPKPETTQRNASGEAADDSTWVMITNDTYRDPAIRRVRSRKQADKDHRHLIKTMGGACDRCKRDKRKCSSSHPRHRHARRDGSETGTSMSSYNIVKGISSVSLDSRRLG